MHVYLMELHILSGERSRSRSSFKVRGQIYVAQIANFMNTEDSNLIFGMHVYLMELHILSGERSRSPFKVKGLKNKFKNFNPNFNLLYNFCNIEDSNLI